MCAGVGLANRESCTIAEHYAIYTTPIASVRRIADAGQVMPRKSTYFAPKVITGLVMHALDTAVL